MHKNNFNDDYRAKLFSSMGNEKKRPERRNDRMKIAIFS